jgi:hypothetical protein
VRAAESRLLIMFVIIVGDGALALKCVEERRRREKNRDRGES